MALITITGIQASVALVWALFWAVFALLSLLLGVDVLTGANDPTAAYRALLLSPLVLVLGLIFSTQLVIGGGTQALQELNEKDEVRDDDR